MKRVGVSQVLLLGLLVGVPVGIAQELAGWGPWTLFVVTTAAMLLVGSVAWHANADSPPRGLARPGARRRVNAS